MRYSHDMADGAKRQLEWSRAGLRELYQSFEFIASRNLPAAVDLRDRIFKAAELLETQPLVGQPGQRPGTREIAVPGAPYTLYRVYAKKIPIGGVLHQRRRYP